MGKYKYTGTGNSGAFSWLMQRISAIVVLVAISYHFLGMITGAWDGLSRVATGCILIFGMWHAINGLKMITDDYVSCRCGRVVLLFLYWAVGIILIVAGSGLLP